MIRQNIVLGDYTYIVDLYKANTDFDHIIKKYDGFYFIKKSDIISFVEQDTDICFISYNDGDKCFPMNKKISIGYSSNIQDFNEYITDDTFETLKYDFYIKDDDDNFTQTPLICDLLRIYIPTINHDINFIVDVENYINSIRFHYKIKIIDMHKISTKSNNEIKVGNFLYSEYIDIYIPSLENLLTNDNLYIKEYDNTNLGIIKEGINYVPFKTKYLPFKINKQILDDKTLYYKEYVNKEYLVNNNLYNTLNVIFYPYDSIDEDGLYVAHKDYIENSEIFINDNIFKLSLDIRFPKESDFNDNNESNNIEDLFDEEYESYKEEPLTFDILEDGELKWNIYWNSENDYGNKGKAINYSINGSEYIKIFPNPVYGSSGRIIETQGNTITVHRGDKVTIKSGNLYLNEFVYDENNNVVGIKTNFINDEEYGNNISIGNINGDYYHYFSSTTRFNISGNLLSIIIGDDYTRFYTEINNARRISAKYGGNEIVDCIYLFKDCDKLIDAKNLVLPTTCLVDGFNSLFKNCTSLTEAPIIPNIKVQENGLSKNMFNDMFNNCNNLNKLICLLDTNVDILRFTNFLRGCSESGTLFRSSSNYISEFKSIIPSGWKIKYYTNGIEEKLEQFNSLEGIPCLFAKFNFNDIINSTLQDNYLFINNLTIDNYVESEIATDEEEYEIKSNDENDITIKRLQLSEEYSLDDTVDKTGFYIEFSSDNVFKDVFYKYSISFNINNSNSKIIDNLIFPLDNIFINYSNYPGLINVRVFYIDKITNTYIKSNPIVIDKEWYKYLVNDRTIKRIHFFNNEVYYNDNNNETQRYMSTVVNLQDKFNFIDRINCSIIKENSSTDNVNVKSKAYGTKIIYKPMFYRANQLQNVVITQSIKQNIGINLSEYMSRVDTFKLVLDEKEYIESGRNDIYVIFNIDAKEISSTGGKYIILSSEDEMISSGNWTID